MNRLFGSGIMLATLLLAAFAVFAQDADDELLPAVDTSIEEDATAVEDLEPAVPSAVLADDVTRSSSGNQVMDRMELGRTEITGNQELPKVLYIVPWQKSAPSDLMGRPVNTLLDEVLAPIDREEFVRQVNYHGDLYGVDEE
ncbi:MAG: hypothetical protein QNJ07_00600 [Woeseiaceae bacterium]|nr:hypothetical protein [Woeseiaceae bacterium]